MTKLFAIALSAMLAASAAVAGECPSTCQSHNVTVVEHAAPAQMVSHHAEEAMKKDIVDTAVSIDSFSTLVAAVKAAGLVDALKADGPYTVFAPTNEAFAKLPEGTLADLLKPENKGQLTNILLYHVVPQKVLAAEVVNVTSADTLLEGKKIAVKVEDGKVLINSSQVVKTDVETSNGVIHVIDTVLLP